MIVLLLQVVLSIPPQVVTWNQSALSPSQAQGYTYKLYIQEESGKKSVVVLLNTLCGGSSTQAQCSTALPSTANAAIISNNYSQLSATDPVTKIESELSGPFKGDQGCIFRNNLYKISQRETVSATKQTINAVRAELRDAKFKEISFTQKGNNFTLLDECVGYIVQ